MPTVQEILKQSGLSDEQIAAIDAKAVSAFGGVLTAAEQAREAAEVAERSNRQFYDQTIAPSLNTWGSEKANLEAQAAFYRAQNEAARAAGFIPEEVPGFQPQNNQPRDAQGRYVPSAPGGTPGSPTFQSVDELRREAGAAIGTLSDIQWRYQKIFGQALPISPTKLIEEANAQRLDPAAYAEKRFGFKEKEAEIAKRAAEEHDAAVAAAATAAADRKWAEKIGSNPDVRLAQPSRFADVARAVRANERPNPLDLNVQQRRQATSQAIRAEIAENAENATA